MSLNQEAFKAGVKETLEKSSGWFSDWGPSPSDHMGAIALSTIPIAGLAALWYKHSLEQAKKEQETPVTKQAVELSTAAWAVPLALATGGGIGAWHLLQYMKNKEDAGKQDVDKILNMNLDTQKPEITNKPRIA